MIPLPSPCLSSPPFLPLSFQFHQVTSLERYVRFKAMDGLVSYAARFPACSVAAGRRITEVVFVLDVKDMVSW